MKLRILHITESLGRGGAEITFIKSINKLPDYYENTVVYLRPVHTLREELYNVDEIICLNFKDKYSILRCALKLKFLIKRYNVDLVHSHLYWPTIITRLAAGRVPVIYSVHNLITYDAFNPNICSKYLEKITYSKNQTVIFVSKAVQKDYEQHIKVTGNKEVIYNFVDSAFLSNSNKQWRFSETGLRLVSVGNLRLQKNHIFLVQSMVNLDHNITLDIYGEGDQREVLEAFIFKHKLKNVRLLGSIASLETELKNYDVFVLGSNYEGFCIAMAEAMAVGLPCVVPNLEVFKEVSGGVQLYYDIGNINDFRNKVLLLLQQRSLMQILSSKSTAVASKYTLTTHVEKLTKLYEKVILERG